MLHNSLEAIPFAWGLRDGDMDYGFWWQFMLFEYFCGESFVPHAFNASSPTGPRIIENDDILAHSNAQHVR